MSKALTIGKVAKQAKVNIQTLRYYERRGLLSPDGRRNSGYRFYGLEAVQRIQFIKNAQGLGFTLKEILSLLQLRVSHRVRCATIKKKTQAKLADVQAKILDLCAIERVLKTLVRTCQNQRTTTDCPVLKSLEIKQGNF